MHSLRDEGNEISWREAAKGVEANEFGFDG